MTVASGAWAAATQEPAVPPRDAWPRQLQLSNATATIYQPQVDRWVLNRVDFHAAVGVKPQDGGGEVFGVIWGSTPAQVDRVGRMVSLGEVTLTKSTFSTLPDDGAPYLAELRTQLPHAARTIALDRIEASLGASEVATPPTVAVNNDPPQILISYAPAILVAIGGEPVWRPVRETHYERIVNARVLVLREKHSRSMFLHVYNGWLVADTLDGPWSVATHVPKQIDAAARDLAADGTVDLLDGGTTPPRPSFAAGVPAIYVRQKPAELIIFKGTPELQPIKGTDLFRAANTTADVIVSGSTGAYYVLISGRWYTAPSLDRQWSYIPSANLPSDFRLIPPGSPAGVVLAAIAGTPQAREAAIANSIPQTATVPRATAPAFSPIYDGAPHLQPIDGTALQYVVNSPTPIICVDAHTCYAVRAGVWYTSAALGAPWTLATSVPEAIYTIPPSFAAALRDLRQDIRCHASRGVRRLYTRVSRYGRRCGRCRRVWNRLRLSAVGREHLVCAARDVWDAGAAGVQPGGGLDVRLWTRRNDGGVRQLVRRNTRLPSDILVRGVLRYHRC